MTAVLEAPAIVDESPVLTAAPASDKPDEAGLRELAAADYLRAAGWGIASGVSAAGVSAAFLPVQYLALSFVLGAGLGVLGYLDQITQLIRNWHTAIFASASAVLIGATQVSLGGDVLLPAVGAAAGTFAFLLILALILPGFVGGGDIKLAPVAAALLAAISPFAALLWLQFMFIGALVGMTVTRLAGNRNKYMAMAPYMAAAVLPALAGSGLLLPSLGL